jgi:hypothetical protein
VQQVSRAARPFTPRAWVARPAQQLQQLCSALRGPSSPAASSSFAKWMPPKTRACDTSLTTRRCSTATPCLLTKRWSPAPRVAIPLEKRLRARSDCHPRHSPRRFPRDRRLERASRTPLRPSRGSLGVQTTFAQRGTPTSFTYERHRDSALGEPAVSSLARETRKAGAPGELGTARHEPALGEPGARAHSAPETWSL